MASEKQIASGIRETAFITLKANETKTIYLKIKLVFDTAILAAISISDSKKYIEQTVFDNLIQGVYQGLLWMMLLYNLFLYVSTREKSYLYYIAYVFSFSVLMLYSFQYIKDYIFFNNPSISTYFSIFVFIAFVFYFLLMREFIASKEKYPRVDKSLKIVILIDAIFTILIFLAQFVSVNSFELMGLQFVLLNTITLLVYIIIIFKIGNKASKIFASGSLFLILFISIATISTMLGGDSDKLIILFQIGIVGEVFIFSVGLSYKYSTIERERQKTQEDLIIQLKENKQLQTKVTRELEQKVKERTAELSTKNKNITDSIKYAKRIQTAMLPSEEQISEILPEHFIFFKPRDIVSGDFYWIKKNKDTLIIAAADSTGHGVPGAFVSMLGISLLNEIIGDNAVHQANKILEKLREQIKISLNQKKEKNSSRDGMDIALCVIDMQTKELQFAGAYNPLYIIRNEELIEIKATRSPIGIFLKEKPFKNNHIQLQDKDRIYMFSDGYADQFGGEEDRKFMSKRFKELLLETAKYSLEKQKQILGSTIKSWKDYRKQNDDIIVMGFEIS